MAKPATFGRALRASFGGHAVVLLVLLAFGAVRGCRAPARPRETLAFIELYTPRPPPVIEPVDELPPPAPDPAPEPEPVPEPEPEPEPAPRWRPAPVVRSDRRVTRPAEPAPPTLSEEDIRRRLREGMTDPAPVAPRSDALAGYLAQVRVAMHEAWVQPSELTAAAGLRPVVRIRVQRDGRVTQRELAAPSGNARMDASVMAAAERVERLPPLPGGVQGAWREIEIGFEISR